MGVNINFYCKYFSVCHLPFTYSEFCHIKALNFILSNVLAFSFIIFALGVMFGNSSLL